MINVDTATSGVDLRYCVAFESLGKDFFLEVAFLYRSDADSACSSATYCYSARMMLQAIVRCLIDCGPIL